MERSLEEETMNRYPSVTKLTAARHVTIVREIFSTIPSGYDFINRVCSLRRDVAWRRSAAKRMRLVQTRRFLDVASGTGDLAIEAALRHPGIQVTALDFTEEMMDLGREKARKRGLSERITFLEGDGLCLPFTSESFDAAGIAFGIRNIPEKVTALREMRRVIVPGGQVLILEIGEPESAFFRWVYRRYMRHLLPLFARVVSSNPDAYHYLWDSIVHFPGRDQFRRLMEKAGLNQIEMYPLTLGIAYLYVGHRPEQGSWGFPRR